MNINNSIVTTTITDNNNALTPWAYGAQTVRTVMIAGEPWFIAADVCAVLELANVSRAVSGLDADERNTITISDGTRGNPTTIVISEPGIYSLIMKSRKPEAKLFRRWVTHEVLPSIRQTGTYSAQPVVPMTPAQMLLAQAQAMVEQERRLASVETTVSAVSSTMQAIEAKMQAQEQKQEQNRQLLSTLPESEVAVPTITPRRALNELIGITSQATGQEAKRLYYDLHRRYMSIYGTNLAILARDEGVSVIQYADDYGHIDRLYALAMQMYGRIANQESARQGLSPGRLQAAFEPRKPFQIPVPKWGEYLLDTED